MVISARVVRENLLRRKTMKLIRSGSALRLLLDVLARPERDRGPLHAVFADMDADHYGDHQVGLTENIIRMSQTDGNDLDTSVSFYMRTMKAKVERSRCTRS